ncbi:MAG: Smr/MutS family protein [Gammaproteobacteria bacterium]|nr:Smr/MutS family protein [Gammaproteobacteria bacterium]MBU1625072.1 Smr/MutS family protein [Gammaproteobacteria bacterium]MBU1981332.1 Smr/MutS family protein [Gammaproteobacteria bacterium]
MKDQPEQDEDLFRQLLDDVTPLKPNDRRASSPTPRKPYLRNAPPEAEIADTLSDHGAGDNAPTEYLSNGLNRMTLRKLRRGEWPVQDELDLHGLNSDEARRLLSSFLHQAAQQGLRCVNVIHGKGWHSEKGEGLLRRLARHWLIQHPLVLAFCDAPLHAGGSGAAWILLKSTARENGSGSSPTV